MILQRVHVLLLSIRCIGRHVILSLSDVTKTSEVVSFIQDGGRKCRVFNGKTGVIKALANQGVQEKQSNMRLWIG